MQWWGQGSITSEHSNILRWGVGSGIFLTPWVMWPGLRTTDLDQSSADTHLGSTL